MRHRVSFYLTIKADTEVDADNPAEAMEIVKNRICEIRDREYNDQRLGLEKQDGDDGCYYGLTLRLPGDMIVYGIAFDPDESVVEEDRPRPRPQLRVVDPVKE